MILYKKVIIILIAWIASFCIGSIDIRTHDFLSTGHTIVIYNVCRLIWTFLFILLIFLIGKSVLRRLFPEHEDHLNAIERFVLSSFIGASIITLIVFLLGYLQLYYSWIFLVLISFVFLFSADLSMLCSIDFYRKGVFPIPIARFYREPGGMKYVASGIYVSVAVMIGIVLLTRVIWPISGGGDVYEHYVPYQMEVIRNHGTWPNDVWIHYYTTKGSSLTFLAILLTDFLGSQIASFSLLISATLALATILYRGTKDVVICGLGMLVFLNCFSHHDSAIVSSFNSHHVQLVGYIAAALWMSIMMEYLPDRVRFKWVSVWSVICLGSIVFFPHTMVLIGLFLCFLVLNYLIRKQFLTAKFLLFLIIICAVGYMAVLLSNQIISGMMMENPTHIMWKFSNQEKFASWCSPYLVEYFLEGNSATHSNLNLPNPLNFGLDEWRLILRMDLLRPIFPNALVLIIFILISAWHINDFTWLSRRWTVVTPLLYMLLVTIMIAPVPGTSSSIRRNYVFVTFPLTAIGLICWKITFDFLGHLRSRLIYFLKVGLAR